MIEIVAAHGRFTVDDLGHVIGRRPRAYSKVAQLDVVEYVKWLQANGLELATEESIDRIAVVFKDGTRREPITRERRRLLEQQAEF